MATARTFAFLFASLLLFSVFWFLYPSHFSSLPHFHGLERLVTWLSNTDAVSFTNGEDFHEHSEASPPTSTIWHSIRNQDSKAPPLFTATKLDLNSLPSAAEELYSITVEVHNEKFQQIAQIGKDPNQKSTDSSEPAIWVEDKNNSSESPSISHNKYSSHVLNHFQADRFVQGDGETLRDITGYEVIQEMEPVLGQTVLNKQRGIYERASNQEIYNLDAATSKASSEIDVVVLGNKNFSNFVSENKYVVVNFYKPLFYRMQVPEFEYAAAASMLKDKVMFAKVDATEATEVTRKYRSQGFHTLYFFIGGVYMHKCRRCSDRFAVVSWVKDKINSGVDSAAKTPKALDLDHENIDWVKPTIVIDSNQDLRMELELIDNGTSHCADESQSAPELNTVEVFNEDKPPAPEQLLGQAMINGQPEFLEMTFNEDSYSSNATQVVELENDTVSLSISNANYSGQLLETNEPRSGIPEQHFDSVGVINVNKTYASLEIREKKIFLDEIVQNKHFNEINVVVLSQKNFSNFVLENKYVVVNIYKPRFYDSQGPALEYAAASFMLKDKVQFAEVDATVEKELARKYGFLGRPTLYFFIGGVHMHTHRFCCSRDLIVNWLNEKMSGGVYNVTRVSQAIDILQSDSMIIVGFFDSLEDPISEELAAASKFLPDLIFYQTASRQVARILHVDLKVKRPALFMLRKGAEGYIHFDGPFYRFSIAEFVSKNKFPLVTTFNVHVALEILRNPMKQLWLFALDDDLEKVMPKFKEAAKALNGKLLFVYINMDHKDVSDQLSNMIYEPRKKPQLVAYSGTDGAIVSPMFGEVSLNNIKSFGEEFHKGTICCGPFPYSEFIPGSLLKW